MNEQKHIINRQILELTVPERARVQLVQNKTSEIVKNKLHPALDVLFSKMVSNDEIIRINKMVIDLGTVTESELENVLVQGTVKKIRNNINKLIISGEISATKKPVNGIRSESTEKFESTSISKDMIAQFVYFLQFGHFPWWHNTSVSSNASGKNNLQVIFTEILKSDIIDLKRSIIPLLRDSLVRQRLVFQFNNSQLGVLMKRLNKKTYASFAVFQNLLFAIKSTDDKKNLTSCFYKVGLQYIGDEQELKNDELKIKFVVDILKIYLLNFPDKEKESVLNEFLQTLQLRNKEEKSENSILVLLAVIHLAVEMKLSGKQIQEIVGKIIYGKGIEDSSLVKVQLKELKKKLSNRTIENEPERDLGNISKENFKRTKVEINEETLFPAPHKPSSDSEGIIISNAGLVLLHPFLRYFFEGLNLLDDELQFKNQSSIYKAIYLLQFIATGKNDAIEANLPLNKILCGLDVTVPIPKAALISAKEKKECIYLIKTVLERWEALKTTNTKALRETYLQREGILKESGEGWNLTVERNTFDVMLEKLPWSINLIKLPWLTQILYVEW